jgi:hypothetical protein
MNKDRLIRLLHVAKNLGHHGLGCCRPESVFAGWVCRD